jgi:hypothetical protein
VKGILSADDQDKLHLEAKYLDENDVLSAWKVLSRKIRLNNN